MSDTKQKAKRFQFRGPDLLVKSVVKSETVNIHQVSLSARVSAQTAYKYLQDSQNVKAVDLKVLYSLLVDGLEMSEKDLLNMKVSDLFKIVEDE